MHPSQAYRALGLPLAASKHDVRRAYRRLIKTWHPDRNADPSAASISARINRAYAALAERGFDPDLEGAPLDADPVDSAPIYRYAQRKGPRRTRPAFHNLYLTIEQGAQGGVFEFVAKTEDCCPTCEGFTTVTTEFPCEPCMGTGRLENADEDKTEKSEGCDCPHCQGTGFMLVRCSACNGSGLGRTADFRFKAIIPKGVRSGELYRFCALGKSSGDARFAAEAIVMVHVIEHPLFGFDSEGRLQVTVPRAKTEGERILIPTLAGPKPLKVPSPDVRDALIAGHGYPERDGSMGDLVVRFG